MLNRILVPLDGSELAEQALEPALALAQENGSEVTLLTVPVLERMLVPAPAGFGLLLPEQSMELFRNEATNYLKSVQQLRTRPNARLRLKVVEGDVAGVIVDTAVEEDVDLIVMSTHGYSGVTRWVLGSVTEKVLRIAPCPVWIVRSATPVRRMLIALDGSELAETALAPGLEVARRLGAAVTLLRAVPDMRVSPSDVDYLDNVENGLGRRLMEQNEAESEAYLAGVKARQASNSLRIRTALWIGQPAQSILDYVDVHDIDLAVMATHGRTGLRRWVYGSVTEKVLRGSRVSMLIIRPDAQRLN